MSNITEKNRSAKQQLIDAGWCIGLGRVLVEKHIKSDSGAVLAYLTILAWGDRGPQWETDGGCGSAQRPPGGWPDTAGTTAPTWRRWLGRAIEIGLISESRGVHESGYSVDLLTPIKPYRTELQDQGHEMPVEQFARLPFSVFSDPKISRTAKRVLVGIAMYRGPTGFARVAVPTIAKMAGLNVRNTHKGLRCLELAGAIKSTGLSRQIRTYEIIEKRPDRVNVGDTRGERGGHQSERQGHQLAITRDTRGERGGHQRVNVGDTLSGTLSRKYSKKRNQEKTLQEKSSGAERRRDTQNGLVLMRVFEGKKDARQESATSITVTDTPELEPTHDERLEKVAELGKLLAGMKATDPCFEMFTNKRDENIAALGGDTELRASA